MDHFQRSHEPGYVDVVVRVLDKVFKYLVKDPTTNRYLNDLNDLLAKLQAYVNKLIVVRKNSVSPAVGNRPQLNFIEGSNITLTVTDSPTDDEIQVTIAAPNPSGATLADGDYGDVTVSSGGTSIQIDANAVGTSEIANDAVTFDKIQNITTDRLLGRDSASSGNTEEVSVGGGLEFTGSVSIQRSALTGDVTAAAGSDSTTIANDAVTYAKIQNVSTTDRVLGRDGAAPGDIEELTISAILDWTA